MLHWDTVWPNLVLVSELFLAYCCSLVLYRLFFHPLRRFPGDKLAAICGWYWDLNASDPDHFGQLHQKYGPVVRIAPNSLHFSQPIAYLDIYSVGSTFAKDLQYYRSFGSGSSFSMTDPHEAKVRRDIIGPLFSRRAILKLEGVIQEKVDLLIAQTISHGDRPVDLYYAFRSTALDIITSYCFAQSWSTLAHPLFQHPMLHAMEQQFTLLWIFHAFPMLHNIIPFLGLVLMRVNPLTKALVIFQRGVAAQVDELLKDPGALDRAEHEIIYHHLMAPEPGKGRHEIPSRKSLIEEAINLTIAGSDTVGGTVTVGVFHVLRNKQASSTLIKELEEAWPDKDTTLGFEVLQKLPYLTAVIKESLRLFSGVVSPTPRIVGPSSARIAGVDIPAGTSVAICSTFLHHNSDIFHDPMTFIPERWLQPNSRELENSLLPFSRGPRSCPGVNLAWSELYLIFGNIFRKLNMEIYDTTIDDLKYKAYFVPVFRKNLCAKVTERRF